MTRSKSLALLHGWRAAQEARSVTSMRALYPSLRGPEALEATIHGAAAVRAIRSALAEAPTPESVPGTIIFVRAESRRAFRAALNAVGLGREL